MTVEKRIEHFRNFMGKTMMEASIDHIQQALVDLDFFNKPASISHHGQNTGDLFYHSLDVARNLVNLTNRLELKWDRPSSPYIVGFLHDLCKCDNCIHPPADVDPEHWAYNNSSILTGHGEKSVIMALKILPLTDEEIACIRWHMGAFDDKENWNNYGHAITVYPNVLYTHTADMIAARIHGI